MISRMSSLSSRNGLKNLKIIRMFVVDKKGDIELLALPFYTIF